MAGQSLQQAISSATALQPAAGVSGPPPSAAMGQTILSFEASIHVCEVRDCTVLCDLCFALRAQCNTSIHVCEVRDWRVGGQTSVSYECACLVMSADCLLTPNTSTSKHRYLIRALHIWAVHACTATGRHATSIGAFHQPTTPRAPKQHRSPPAGCHDLPLHAATLCHAGR
jgi:hypothetical protein